jgi:hypothetical protein
MADTAVAAPTKAPKKKTAAKPKKPSDHPKYSEMVGRSVVPVKINRHLMLTRPICHCSYPERILKIFSY